MALPAKGRGRKPAHFTALGGRPRGRQAMWEQIRTLRSFTVSDLASAAYAERDAVRTYVESLLKAKYLTRTKHQRRKGQKDFLPAIYKLVRDIGIEAPRVRRDGSPCLQGLGREQMWLTMRLIGTAFTARELAIAASTDKKIVSPVDANDYTDYLARAGYLAIVERTKPPKPMRYRFLPQKYTGPKPPMIQRLKTVFDPNLGQIVWHEGADA